MYYSTAEKPAKEAQIKIAKYSKDYKMQIPSTSLRICLKTKKMTTTEV